MISNRELMDEKREKDLLTLLVDYLKDKPTPFLVLIISSVLVVFSIVYGRYFAITFLTFVYALGATYLIIARKQESLGEYITGSKWGLMIWAILFVGWFAWFLKEVLPEILNLEGHF